VRSDEVVVSLKRAVSVVMPGCGLCSAQIRSSNDSRAPLLDAGDPVCQEEAADRHAPKASATIATIEALARLGRRMTR